MRVQEKHILFTFIYMYATQQDAPHRNQLALFIASQHDLIENAISLLLFTGRYIVTVVA
jgi:hypothetical protein